MKKLMILAFLLLVIFESKSQGFEGSATWSMKMDITDPKMKAQMDEAQTKMQDPKMQAQLKELQAKMNDPEFKKQMDANPQIKAQMENMLKMAQGSGQGGTSGGGMGGMMPTGMTLKIKNGNALTTINGGMMDGSQTLYLKDKNQVIKLDRKNKTYSIIPNSDHSSADKVKASDVKFTKTNETTKILGYNCTKYVATMTEGGKTVNESFWTTTELKDFDLKSLGAQRLGQSNRTMIPAGLEGTPLKIEMAMAQGAMVMEMTEIKKESLPASDFTIPSDYTETKLSMQMGRP